MTTQLDTILAALRADPGLKAGISARDMARGLAAADALNVILMKMIDQSNVNDDGRISARDMMTISTATYANPADYVGFLEAHGNDNGTVETGFHYLQNDGGTLQFRGRAMVDTVIDAIYHFGFKIVNGRYYNEDGNDNETAADVAGWLNYFLNGENLVWGGGGNDDLGSGTYSEAFADARNETFLAGDGNDRVWADIGNDKVYGGNGHDQVGGGDGNDVIWGEAGKDDIWGEAGADSLYGGDGGDVLGGGDGNDLLDAGGNHDTLYGGEGMDSLTGGSGNDTLSGDAGTDRLDGGLGDDTLHGGDAGDALAGGDGNDALYGGSGGDLIRGGLGADKIYIWESMQAADKLVFRLGDSGRSGSTIDRIEGFESGTDKIMLEGMGTVALEDLDYRGGVASCFFDGRYLRIDADGDRATDMILDFAWTGNLVASDFAFV